MAGPGGSASLGAWATPEASVSKRGDRTAYCEANPKAGNDLGSQSLHWPTPAANEFEGGDPQKMLDRREREKAKGRNGNGFGLTLGMAVAQTEQWMTPSVSNSQGNEYTRDRGQEGQERLTLTGQSAQRATPTTENDQGMASELNRHTPSLSAQTAQWPTPGAGDDRGASVGWDAAADRHAAIGQHKQMMLRDMAPRVTEQWPTPASRDFRTPNSQESQESQESRTIHGGEQLPNYVEHHFSLHPVHSTLDGRPLSPTARTLRRRLNPAFGCWLMGWPIWWTNPGLTNCARSAMESWRFRLQQHLSSYSEGRG